MSLLKDRKASAKDMREGKNERREEEKKTQNVMLSK